MSARRTVMRASRSVFRGAVESAITIVRCRSDTPRSNNRRSESRGSLPAREAWKDRIVETSSEAEALFTEVKRFLILAQGDDTKKWTMYSHRIDECWHQF